MKEVIAALMMLGPWATEEDVWRARDGFAREIVDCDFWMAPNSDREGITIMLPSRKIELTHSSILLVFACLMAT